jgi:hypothetical protein
MHDSQEEHDAALAAEEAYWRAKWTEAQARFVGHVCAGRELRCDDCGAQLTGDALDDSVARMEARADAMRDERAMRGE